MTPFHFHDEILIHPVSANFADGLAGTDEHVLFDAPGLRRRIDEHPSGEILAIEQRPKAVCIIRVRLSRSESREEKNDKRCDMSQTNHLTRAPLQSSLHEISIGKQQQFDRSYGRQTVDESGFATVWRQ